MSKIIEKIEQEREKKDLVNFGPGDTLSVKIRVKEGSNLRIQTLKGVVIGKRNRGLQSSFVLRKISAKIGVERILPIHSPLIEEIKVDRRGKVRRAKLNYIRKLSAKKARIKEKRTKK